MLTPSASAGLVQTSTSAPSDEADEDEDEDDEDDAEEQVHIKHDDHVANMDKSYLHMKEVMTV